MKPLTEIVFFIADMALAAVRSALALLALSAQVAPSCGVPAWSDLFSALQPLKTEAAAEEGFYFQEEEEAGTARLGFVQVWRNACPPVAELMSNIIESVINAHGHNIL